MPVRQNEQGLYWRRLRQLEKTMLKDALHKHGSISAAAPALGISKNYMSEKLKQFGIPAPSTRPGPKPRRKGARK